jgi:hypothetical protein
MLLQDLDAILHYYVVKYSLQSGKLVSLPGDRFDMARILARLTILLIGTHACTPYIISSVWSENEDVHLALGGPCGDLSLIHWRLPALSKIAINTIYIWTTDPDLPILAPDSQNFKCLSPTFQTLLLHSCEKITYACKPVPSGAASAKLLTDNLQARTSPDKSPFKTKAIQLYRDLLLNQHGDVDDMVGVENGILVAYRMCPPCEPPCSAT